jgi:prepilin-type N-terminal cleavage/methylation domain-containing protein
MKGFSLLELVIVMAIITVLAVIALPNVAQIEANTRQRDALTRVRQVVAAELAYTTNCTSTPQPASCMSLAAILPMPGTVQMEGYTFVFTPQTANPWSYTATPTSGQGRGVYADGTGLVRCAAVPPAVPASPLCN